MRTSLLLLALSTSLTGLAWAGDTDDDGPGRGVARISVMNGDVSVRRGDSGDWVAAAINAPLVVQDRVLTGPASRAEVQFDYANMVRLGSDAEVRLAELDYQRYLVQVARGTVTFRVLRDSRSDVEVSTPNVSVRPTKRGIYRITVHDDGTSEITVRSGEADIYSPRGSERLKSGRTMVARGTASDPEFQIVNAVAYDDWDRWNESRDQALERTTAYRYVSSDIYGADDLDPYGSWVYAPPYGWTWSPTVAAGWAPYRYGRWVWVDWYGWTWVSSDPWGWAPYHYGRWFMHGSRWCWWPGGMQTRTYWRPGLVAFFGYGGGVGVGWGNVGWVPLAPYETYYPWYGRRYYGGYRNTTVNNITIVNNTNIINSYRNARIANGVTGVDGASFGRNHGAYTRVAQDQIRQVNLARGPLPVAPDRSSLRWSDREVRTPAIASRGSEGRFFSRGQPTQVNRIPFDQQQRGVEQMLRRSGAGSPRMAGSEASRPSAVGGGRQAAGGGRAADMPRGGADNNEWRRTAEPARQQERTAPVAEWRRFGDSGGRTDGVKTTERPAESPRGAGGSSPARTESRPADSGSWRRFGDPGRAATPEGRSATQSETPRGGGQSTDAGRVDRQPGGNSSPRVESPRSTPQRDTPRSDSGRASTSSGQQRFVDSGGDRLRMSPSIVHERPSAAPRMESAPRMSSPAPRMESAPRQAPSGGGGGGSSRGGGGGGGSSRGGESRGGGRSR